MLKEIKEAIKSACTIITVGVLNETSVSGLNGTSGMVLRELDTIDDFYLKLLTLACWMGEAEFSHMKKAGVNAEGECMSSNWAISITTNFDLIFL